MSCWPMYDWFEIEFYEKEYDVRYLSYEDLGTEAHTAFNLSGGMLGFEYANINSEEGWLTLFEHGIVDVMWQHDNMFYYWTQDVFLKYQRGVTQHMAGDVERVGFKMGMFFYAYPCYLDIARGANAHGLLGDVLVTEDKRPKRKGTDDYV